MKTNTILDEDLKFLDLNTTIKNNLKNNNIIKIRDLWQLKRKDLKNFGISDNDISHIIIKLQLNGLDLNKKIY